MTRFTGFLALFGHAPAGILRPRRCSGCHARSARAGTGETQSLIGYFLNTIVYRLDLSGNPTFLELLQRTRSITLEALANSDLPFEFLLNKLGAQRDPSRSLAR